MKHRACSNHRWPFIVFLSGKSALLYLCHMLPSISKKKPVEQMKAPVSLETVLAIETIYVRAQIQLKGERKSQKLIW